MGRFPFLNVAPVPRRFVALALGLGLTGCTPPPAQTVSPGTVHVRLESSRQVQYRASQVKILTLSLTNQATQQRYEKDFPASRLGSSANGATLSFGAQHLPAGAYVAQAIAYLDTAKTLPGGTSTSSPFSVSGNAVTPVMLPALQLAATPTAQWTVTIATSNLTGGFKVSQYDFALKETDPTRPVVTHTAMISNSTQSSQSVTWKNVLAYPAGVSTTSVTVTATRNNGERRIATASVAVSLEGGTVITSPTVTVSSWAPL